MIDSTLISAPSVVSVRPILPGFNPDPTVVSLNGDYFIATSTFENFPGIAVYHSTDLRSWVLIGHALTRKSQLDLRTVEASAGIWAPTLRYHNGYFYVVCSCFSYYKPSLNEREFPLGFHVKTNNIWDSESWSECVYFDTCGFDQDLFWDTENGNKCYLAYTRPVNRADLIVPTISKKNFGTFVSEVDLETGRSLSKPVLLRESESGVAEGAHIYREHGYYYLLVAEGGTSSGHHEVVLRSKELYGPYEQSPYGVFLQSSKKNTKKNIVHDTGHADLFKDAQGNWWVVFLGCRHRYQGDSDSNYRLRQSPLGRETFMLPCEWENGWPVLKDHGECYLEEEEYNTSNHFGKAPFAGLYSIHDPCDRIEKSVLIPTQKDPDDPTNLPPHWYTKHTPLRKFFSLTERPNHLRLYGLPYTLDRREHIAALFHKQTSFEGLFVAQLELPEPEPDSHYEAGITIWYSRHSYGALGLVPGASGNSYKVVYRARAVGEEPYDHTVAELLHKNDWADVCLLISCTFDEYKLGFVYKEKVEFVGTVASADLLRDPPEGGLYTGAMFGLYATGNGEPARKPADFSCIRWTR